MQHRSIRRHSPWLLAVAFCAAGCTETEGSDNADPTVDVGDPIAPDGGADPAGDPAGGDAPGAAEPPTARDDLALTPYPGGAVAVDVLHNDGEDAELASVESSEGAARIEDGWVVVEPPEGFRGEIEVTCNLNNGATSTLTVFVASAFDGLIEVLESPMADDPGRRVVDAYAGDDGQTNLLLRFKHGDRLILDEAWGDWDPETTQQPMASASKWMAAAMALHAVDAGVIDLDMTMAELLPTFTNPALDDTWSRGDITVRQAFAMTHGLNTDHRYHTMRQLDHETSVEAIRAGLPVTEGCYEGWTCGEVTMAFEPGTWVGYDGKGFQVAGWGILKAFGAYDDWEDYATRALFEPCGMHNTDWSEFKVHADGRPMRVGGNAAVAGGVRTTANDYLRFLDMLHAGGRCGDVQVLSEASVDAFFEFALEPEQGEPWEAPIWEGPWPNCGEEAWGNGAEPADCSTWLHGEPTGGTYFVDAADNLRYAFGAWAVEVDGDGQIESVTSPGAFGTAPFWDRTRDIRGVLFSKVDFQGDASPTEPHAHILANAYVLKAVRDRMEALQTSVHGDLAPTEDR